MTTFDWIIVVVVNASVIAYGIYLARGTKTSGEWFLGNRALPWWLVGLSMFATNVDNFDLVSMGGTGSVEGFHVLTVHSLGSVIAGILVAFFIAPALYRAGLFTNAEYLEARFGRSARALSALIQIQYRANVLGLMMWSIILLLMALVDLTEQQALAVVIVLVVFSALYTAWGGLRSVVITDALQGVVMMAGAIVVFVAVWTAAGGWTGMEAKLEAISAAEVKGLKCDAPKDLTRVSSYRGASGSTSPFVVVLGWIIIAGGYWTVNHTQMMRLLGTRSLWDMRVAALCGTAISLPIMIVAIMIGFFGRALHPELEHADEIFPFLANRYLVFPGLKGVVVAALIAAAVSTFDSMGSALSAVFTRDLYARFFVRNRGDAHYVAVGRIATCAVLGLGFLYLPFIKSQSTMLGSFVTLISVFVTPLFVLYVAGAMTRTHPRSGIVGLLAVTAYGLVALCDREQIWAPWLPGWVTGKWAAFLWSVGVTAAAMAVTTLLLGPKRVEPPGAAATSSSGWLARSSAQLPPLREHPFRDRVPRLLNPVWIAGALLALSAYLVFVVFW